MEKKRSFNLLWVPVLVLLLAGCGAGDRDPLCGDWAYNHDPETAVLTLRPSGKASFKGQEFTWARCEEGITLTGADGTASVHRCVEEKERILFYVPTVYTRTDGAGGLVGRWRSAENWSFEFTEKGTFLEDGVLPGHYFADEAAGTVRLAYNDPLEDAVLYYTLSDGQLRIEYPWPMVRAK